MVAGLFLTLPALFLSSAFFPQEAATAGLAAGGHHRQPAASVIETGQRLVNTGDDWGQDLRTLVAAAVAGLVLGARGGRRLPGGHALAPALLTPGLTCMGECP
jgi:hypothetical protein